MPPIRYISVPAGAASRGNVPLGFDLTLLASGIIADSIRSPTSPAMTFDAGAIFSPSPPPAAIPIAARARVPERGIPTDTEPEPS